MKGFLDNYMHPPPAKPSKETLENFHLYREAKIKKFELEEIEKKLQKQKERKESRGKYLEQAILNSSGYELWLKKDFWYLDEAIALLFGKDPKMVSGFFFDEAMRELQDLALRSIAANTLTSVLFGNLWSVKSSDFLRWALAKEFDLPPQLKSIAEKFQPQIANPKNQKVKESTKNSKFSKGNKKSEIEIAAKNLAEKIKAEHPNWLQIEVAEEIRKSGNFKHLCAVTIKRLIKGTGKAGRPKTVL